MDARGKLRASVNYEFPQIYPRPGWVEHRPADIWSSVTRGIRAILRKKLCRPADIVAIGITNQRETAMLVGPPQWRGPQQRCRLAVPAHHGFLRFPAPGRPRGADPAQVGPGAGSVFFSQ